MKRKVLALYCLVMPKVFPADFSTVQNTEVSAESVSYSHVAANSIYAGPWRDIWTGSESEPMETPQSERWRLLIIPPAEEGETELVLEHVVMGAEGCCQRVAGQWWLKISRPGEFAFVEWQGPRILRFRLSSEHYVLNVLDSGRFEVVPYVE